MANSSSHDKIKLFHIIANGLKTNPAYLLIFGIVVISFFFVSMGAAKNNSEILYFGLIYLAVSLAAAIVVIRSIVSKQPNGDCKTEGIPKGKDEEFTDKTKLTTQDIWKGKSKEFTKFWKGFLDKKTQELIYVIISGKGYGHEFQDGKPVENKRGHTVKVSFSEVKEFINLQGELNIINNNLKLIFGGNKYKSKKGELIEMRTPDYEKDKKLIIIGSTNANEVCKEIMTHRDLDLPYKFSIGKDEGEEYKIVKTETKEYPLSYNESKKLDNDYGIILRVRNPNAGSNIKILILGGNHGPGTQAAINFVTFPTSEMLKIIEKAGEDDFIAIFKARTNQIQGFGLEIIELSRLEGKNWNEQDLSRL